MTTKEILADLEFHGFWTKEQNRRQQPRPFNADDAFQKEDEATKEPPKSK